MVTLPRIAPMLATPGSLPPEAVEDRWAFEVKHDGQRAIVYLPGDGTVTLRARSGTDITPAYPELAGLGSALDRPAVLDGEIVALDSEGRSDFERLQSRMGLAGSPAKAARMAQIVPAHLVLFDVVFLGRSSLTKMPYTERRTLLEGLGLAGAHWSTPAAVVGHGAQAVAAGPPLFDTTAQTRAVNGQNRQRRKRVESKCPGTLDSVLMAVAGCRPAYTVVALIAALVTAVGFATPACFTARSRRWASPRLPAPGAT
ncbi:hypothetical protein ACFU9X_20550 [Streptomyces atratus]|uniref:ATP-dependent DNA ligase n=1 Tax=Streptomyces atratus TaxID=1893 RepID=UPI0036BD28BB